MHRIYLLGFFKLRTWIPALKKTGSEASKPLDQNFVHYIESNLCTVYSWTQHNGHSLGLLYVILAPDELLIFYFLFSQIFNFNFDDF